MSFVQEIEKQLEERFRSFGFERKATVLVKPLGPGASEFLGLPRQVFSNGVVSVSATIGVRFEPFYALGRNLGAYPESKTNPTLSVPLRYLGPPGSDGDYRFLPDRDNQDEIDRLVGDVQRYGALFYDTFSSPDKAREAILQNAVPELMGKAQFVPLYYALRRDLVEAVRFAKENLAGMDASRGTGKQYAQFVAKLNE